MFTTTHTQSICDAVKLVKLLQHTLQDTVKQATTMDQVNTNTIKPKPINLTPQVSTSKTDVEIGPQLPPSSTFPPRSSEVAVDELTLRPRGQKRGLESGTEISHSVKRQKEELEIAQKGQSSEESSSSDEEKESSVFAGKNLCDYQVIELGEIGNTVHTHTRWLKHKISKRAYTP
jgi:hypothetical protein